MNDVPFNQRVAEAILDRGSKEYTVRAGALLTLLSELALEGDLEGLSRAYVVYAELFPADVGRVADAVPAKVLNQYLYKNRECATRAIGAWQSRNPEWARDISGAVDRPAHFAAVVDDMLRTIKALDR